MRIVRAYKTFTKKKVKKDGMDISNIEVQIDINEFKRKIINVIMSLVITIFATAGFVMFIG
jgi:hypothetical protein